MDLRSNKNSPSVRHKRKLEFSSSESKKNGLYAVFSPVQSPEKAKKSPSSAGSPPSSRKKLNLTLKQGASQNNKIMRYLKPKRLLPHLEEARCATGDLKENTTTNSMMTVRVQLIRLDDEYISPNKKAVAENFAGTLGKENAEADNIVETMNNKISAAEYVTGTLDNILSEERRNPSERLGVMAPACVQPVGCHHPCQNAEMTSSLQDSLYDTMVDVDLSISMIRSCWKDLAHNKYPSPVLSHKIFKIMKESADVNVIALGCNFLKHALTQHPPCTKKMKEYYFHILNSPESQVQIPSGLWSLRSLIFFDEILSEVEGLIESLMSPTQLKEKLRVPGKRKVRKPERFRDSPDHSRSWTEQDSETNYERLDDEGQKKREMMYEALQKMTDEQKIYHVFCRFEILVDILERDLIIWLSRNTDFEKIRDRTTCPLVVLALWKPSSDTGYDSVHCRRIFAMYTSAWILEFHVHHLKTLARLIGLIAEVTSASEPNSGKEYPFFGDGCKNLARKLCENLKNPELEENKFHAIGMLKPDWLKMLLAANLLNVPPSISSMDLITLYEPMNDASVRLWALFLEAVIECYHLKQIMDLLIQTTRRYFQEETLPQPKLSTQECHTNYTSLLWEIKSYYELRCQIMNHDSTAGISNLLQLILV